MTETSVSRNQVKVCKFGGTSLADVAQIIKVRKIIESDPERRYIVPSAPGKRSPDDRKITDLLYLCHAHALQNISFDDVFKLVADRYRQIVTQLGLRLNLESQLDQVRAGIFLEARDGGLGEYAASRGEYLNGLIMAEMLGFTFLDAAKVIAFTEEGIFDGEATQRHLSVCLKQLSHAVIPGFYGSDSKGRIRTFSRGGSDISGAIVARAANATVYENWTDVSGMLMANPAIVCNARPIRVVTYRELRELAYMGATVLHDESIFPVRLAGIPIHICNTNKPLDVGTMILADAPKGVNGHTITGIAGRKDFTVIQIEKAMMNAELGFGRRLLTVLEANGVNFEHMPTGIDTMSVIIADKQLEGKLDKLLNEIRQQCEPESVELKPHMALIAVVGRGMTNQPGVAASIFTALAQAGINVRMIDQGSSEINVIIGVDTTDFEKAVKAIYAAFVH